MSPERDPDAGGLDPRTAEQLRTSATRLGGDTRVLSAVSRITGEAPKVMLRDEASAHLSSPFLRSTTEGSSLPRSRGQYQLLGEIARGGMGVVLKGHDMDLGRDVAVKVMHAEYSKQPEILQRFVEEAQIGGQLQHPGIVPVYELGLMADDRPYFAMKLVKGKTLASHLSERKTPSDERRHFLDVFESVCQTMAYCHSRGVIHRDLKPSNVMVGAFGEVQVVDWGLSKVMRQGGNADERRAKERHTQISIIETVRSGSSTVGTDSVVGSIMGTVAYMPPEQARGDVDKLDERSDVFALGAILCEILTGLPPYPGPREEAVSNAAMGRTEAAFERLDGCGMEKALIELTKECLLPAQSARPRSAEVLAARIRSYLGSVEERATQARIEAAQAQVKAAEERRARKLTLSLAGSILVTLLVGGGGWAWMRTEREARARHTAEQVDAALAEAGRARGARNWTAAREAVLRARAALLVGQASSEIEPRIASVSQAIEREASVEREHLEREAKNAAFLESLDSIHNLEGAIVSTPAPADPKLEIARSRSRSPASARRELNSQVSTVSQITTPGVRESAYAQAFREYIVDVDPRSDAEVAAAVRASGIRIEIALALDDWAWLRRQIDRGWTDRATRLERLAMEVDDDAGRRDLRAAILKDDSKSLLAFFSANKESYLTPATAGVLGAALRRIGQDPSALELLRKVRSYHPSELSLLLQLSGLLLDLKPPRAGEAVGYLMAARALRPESAAILSWLADAYSGERKFDQAVANMRESARSGSATATSQVRLGRLLQLKGDLEEGITALRNAVALDPAFASAWFELGLALERNGSLDEAIPCYRRAIRIDPGFAAAHNNLGTCLYREGEVDAAIESYREAIESDSRNASAHFNLAHALEEKDEVDSAIESYREASRLAPREARSLLDLGILLERKGDPDSAIQCFRRTIAIDPERADGDYHLGMTLASKGEVNEAIGCLRKAVDLDGWNAEFQQGLAGLLDRNGDIRAAIECYRKAIEIDPQCADAYRDLAFALERKGEHDAASECSRKAFEGYRTAAQTRPTDASAQSRLAVFLATTFEVRLRDPKEAVRFAQRAVDLAGETGETWNALGVARWSAGDWKGSIEAIKRSLDLNSGGGPKDWLHLAVAYHEVGDVAEGRSWYDAAVEWMDAHEPNAPELKRLCSETESVLGAAAGREAR